MITVCSDRNKPGSHSAPGELNKLCNSNYVTSLRYIGINECMVEFYTN